MKKLISLILALVLTVACLSGMSFAADAEASYTVGTTTKEGTLAAAVKAVSPKGGTIKLLKDVNYTKDSGYAISSTESFTLDLNGHTLNSAALGISVSTKATGVTVIKNGKIISKKINANISGGGLQMKNVEAWCETQQNIAFYDRTGTYNTKNVIEDCVFANPVWGAFAFNSTSGSMAKTAVLVRNTTFINSKPAGGNAIVIQTKAVSSKMVVAEGVKFMSFLTGATSYTQKNITVTGEKVTKQEAKATVEVCGHKIENLTVWTTPEKATGADITVKDAVALTGPECTYTAGGVTKEGTLAEAGKAITAAKGGTVKLLRDVEHDNANVGYAINADASFTLDLNGHTITSVTRGVGVSTKATGVTVIKNGTINSEKICANIEGGGLHVQNVTMWCNTQQCIGVYDTTGKWNDKNLIEGSTLANPVWGSLAFNNTKESMANYTMTVRNSTIINSATAGGNAVVIQGKAVTSNLVLGEGVQMLSFSKNASVVQSAVKVSGVAIAKSAAKTTLKVCDHELKDLTVWKDAEEVKAEAEALTKPFDHTLIPAEPTSETAEVGYYVAGKSKEIKEGTLKEAVAAITDKGGAIRLYKDIENKDDKSSYAIVSKSSFTLDLNGHFLKSVTRGVSITGAGFKGTTMITNSKKNRGIIETNNINVNITSGGMVLKDVAMWCNTQQNVAYYDTTGQYNDVNLIEGTTLVNPVWGAFAFNNTSTSMEGVAVTMRNSTLANVKSGGGNSVVIQSKAVGANIIAGEGMKFLTFSSGATSYTQSAILFFGEPVTKQVKKETLNIGEKTFKNLTAYTTPEKATVKPFVKGEGPEVQYTVGGVTKKGTMAEAEKAVSPKGGTIKLLQDYHNDDFTRSYAISTTESFTLDLNGFTLSSVSRGVGVSNKATGVTTIIDTTGGGKISSAKLNLNVYGGIHVNYVNMWSASQQNIAYYDATGAFNETNIIENSIIANPSWGAVSFNNTRESMEKTTLTVRNSTLANVGSSNAVVMQSKAVAPNLILGEGVKLITKTAAATAKGIVVSGNPLTTNTKKVTFEAPNGKTYEKMTLYFTADPLLPPVLPIISIDCAYTVDGVTVEGPMADAIKAVSPAGGTIKMLKDYSFIKETRTYALVSDSSFILDLNGHTIKSAGSGINVTGKGVVGTTYITDTAGGGAIVTENICVNVEKGALHLNGVTMWSNVQQNISYMDTSAAFNGKNVIENSVLGNPAWGALVFNNAKADQTATSFTVKNSTLVNGYKKGGSAIAAQTKSGGANVVLGEGLKLMTYEAAPVQDIVKTSGQTADIARATENVDIAGKKLSGLTVYKTKAPATAPQLPTAEGAKIPTTIDPVYVGSNGATVGGVPVVPGGSIADVAVPKTGK